MQRVVGIILAGGLSSRMGTSKALLKIPETTRTLLDNTMHVLQEVSMRFPLDRIYISGTVPGYSTIPDRIPRMGPIGGIDGILFQNEWSFDLALVVPVDMPMLTSSVLECLFENMTGHRLNAVYYRGHELPMMMRLGPQVRKLFDELICRNSRDRSVRNLLGSLRCRVLIPSEAQSIPLQGVNTPADWYGLLPHKRIAVRGGGIECL
ncbi:MAG: molybdenum cofactor guanylyltransferase [Deltaproteobacteria bacterium]|nr:molybdenum cofactor guanylyltransferase [Deltaproteobacteria bacterium]